MGKRKEKTPKFMFVSGSKDAVKFGEDERRFIVITKEKKDG